MKRKQIITLVAAIFMVLTSVIGVSAESFDNGVSPCWSYMDTVDLDLNFSGTSGNATLTVTRIFQITTKIEGTLTVYKWVGNDWQYVDSVSDESTRGLDLEVDFTAESGVTYKAVADITAYGSNGSEPETVEEIRIYHENEDFFLYEVNLQAKNKLICKNTIDICIQILYCSKQP